MPRKKKPCKVCGKAFEPKRPLQQVLISLHNYVNPIV